jgi:hypothetical protein
LGLRTAPPRPRHAGTSPARRNCSGDASAADAGTMWTYVLRHRLLLRAIYARSEPLAAIV